MWFCSSTRFMARNLATHAARLGRMTLSSLSGFPLLVKVKSIKMSVPRQHVGLCHKAARSFF